MLALQFLLAEPSIRPGEWQVAWCNAASSYLSWMLLKLWSIVSLLLLASTLVRRESTERGALKAVLFNYLLFWSLSYGVNGLVAIRASELFVLSVIPILGFLELRAMDHPSVDRSMDHG